MNLARTLTICVLMLVASLAQAGSDPKIVDLSMPVLDYARVTTNGKMIGRHHAPLVFTVGADQRIRSLIAGSVRSKDDKVIPPFDEALIDALRRGDTSGFTEAESAVFGPRFLSALTTTLTKNSVQFPPGGAVVLIRNTSPGGELDETFHKRDRKWEETLRASFQDIMPSAHLVIIRLSFPNQ